MFMIPVESSNIKAVGYSSTTFQLRVEFLNGTSYLYDGVPYDVYDAVLNAESVGKSFNALVKGKFPFKKED